MMSPSPLGPAITTGCGAGRRRTGCGYEATHDFDDLTWLIGQVPVAVTAMESKTVFTGDMPAGLRCLDCLRQQACPESPYNLIYLRSQTERVEPID